MGNTSSSQTFDLPAGKWVKVFWAGGINIFGTYRLGFSAPGTVEWRRISAGPPWFVFGTYNVTGRGHQERFHWVLTDFYVQYELKSNVDLQVTVEYPSIDPPEPPRFPR